ncbi:MAG: hypothetical protein IKB51_02680 [Clostridia bacterium]|nr:hypothetical protein [Clostridia bacterium]
MKVKIIKALGFAVRLMKALIRILSGGYLCKCGCDKEESEIKETENK